MKDIPTEEEGKELQRKLAECYEKLCKFLNREPSKDELNYQEKKPVGEKNYLRLESLDSPQQGSGFGTEGMRYGVLKSEIEGYGGEFVTVSTGRSLLFYLYMGMCQIGMRGRENQHKTVVLQYEDEEVVRPTFLFIGVVLYFLARNIGNKFPDEDMGENTLEFSTAGIERWLEVVKTDQPFKPFKKLEHLWPFMMEEEIQRLFLILALNDLTKILKEIQTQTAQQKVSETIAFSDLFKNKPSLSTENLQMDRKNLLDAINTPEKIKILKLSEEKMKSIAILNISKEEQKSITQWIEQHMKLDSKNELVNK